MKHVKLLFLIAALCFATFSKGQDIWKIQNDLDSYYQRVQYWNLRYQLDSAAKASESLKERLVYYTSTCPATMKMTFKYLKYYDGLKIYTSNDKSFRIYQWDDESGATGHNYVTVFQYVIGGEVHSATVLPGSVSQPGSNQRYKDLYTLKTASRVYYLATYAKRFSNNDVFEGIEVFSKDDKNINDSISIIKTTLADTAYSNYGYELFDAKGVTTHSIYFDKRHRTIYFPQVNKEYMVSSAYVAYKFNGQFFKEVAIK